MAQEIKDIRLIIEIKNKEPLQLIDLTKSLIALGNQFNAYVAKNGDSKENREAKLYVKEIKTGSVILDLIEFATVGSIPFLENVNTIIGFAGHCKAVIEHYLKGEGEKPEMTETDYREMSAIVNPVAKDNGSQINISTTVNGNLELHVHLDSIEANAIQNKLQNEITILRVPEQTDGVHSKVLFYWYQARNDVSSDTGNKGVIESIGTNPLRVIFEPYELKEQMIKGETNPFTHAFVVDARVETIKGKPTIYKIIKVHETIDRTD